MMNRGFRLPVLGRGGGKAAAPVPWYLAGGIDAAACKGAYQFIGAASAAAARINLINPGTYDIVNVAANGPTWSAANGFTFTDASGYDFVSTQITETGLNMTLIVRISNGPTDGAKRWIMGAWSAGNFGGMSIGRENSNSLWWCGLHPGLSTAPVTSGVLCLAGHAAYVDGGKVGDTPAGGVDYLQPIYLGGAYYRADLFTGNILAAAVYDAILTAPQVAAVSARMAALPL